MPNRLREAARITCPHCNGARVFIDNPAEPLRERFCPVCGAIGTIAVPRLHPGGAPTPRPAHRPPVSASAPTPRPER